MRWKGCLIACENEELQVRHGIGPKGMGTKDGHFSRCARKLGLGFTFPSSPFISVSNQNSALLENSFFVVARVSEGKLLEVQGEPQSVQTY